jgi:4-hydroxythreonine-4-phosphate dehydrogenase
MLPRIAITLGDVAGVGPEVAIAACADLSLREHCRLLLVGDLDVARRAVDLTHADVVIESVEAPDFGSPSGTIGCWNPTQSGAAADVPIGRVDARAGRAAFAWLTHAAKAALDGNIDAITTAPINKYALHEAGHNFPGHTEILADVCDVVEFAMMLYLPPDALQAIRGEIGRDSSQAAGLGIAHVTLHTSIESVPGLLSTDAVRDTIQLMHNFLGHIGRRQRIGVAALNPHAGEDGLFGDEEARVIAPAVAAAVAERIEVQGPFPTDTLIRRAIRGEFDGVVAMYHDQGHIPFKLIGFDRAVNVTLGLPIVRTSPSHGTAFDIAWQNRADPRGMIESIRLAAQLAQYKLKTNSDERQ